MEKKKKIFNIIISLLFGFQQFFFFPMEIYYSDKQSYALASKYFAIPMLILALLFCSFAFVILSLLLKKSEKLHKYISLLLLGYILASYIQAMFLNDKMGKITGESIVDYNDVSFITWDLEIYFGLVILPFVIYFIKNKYVEKLKKVVNCNLAIYFSSLLFFMQFMGYVSNYVKFYNENKSIGKRMGCFTYETSMHLSNRGNIIVFLTDRVDGYLVDDLIIDYPELNEYFDGFTYYKDNCSYYTATYPSVVSMFSKTKLEEINKSESYFDVVWKNENLPKILKKNGYDIYMHMDKGTTYNNIEQVEKICDNFISKKLGKEAKVKYNKIIKTMVDFSFLRSMPYIAKGAFVLYYDSDFANDFIVFDYEKYSDIQKQMVGEATDLDFYNYLKENGLKKDNVKPVFSFIHLNGVHDKSDKIASLYNKKSTGNLEEETLRGECEILNEYIKQMKDLGIYNNSIIIILSDHNRTYGPVVDYEGNIRDVAVSALLIKEKYVDNVPLKINDESQMSNDFFYDSILEYAGIKNKDSGCTYQSVYNNDNNEDNIRTMRNMKGEVYEVNGNARDIRNWKRKE